MKKIGVLDQRIQFNKMYKEHTRAIIWPRNSIKGPEDTVYRYPIVGVIVSNTPIDIFEDLKSTLGILIDGDTTVLESLAEASRGEVKFPLGDATDVMCGLNDICERFYEKEYVDKWQD